MSDSTKVTVIQNRDNHALHPGNEQVVIGYVDEVNGPGSAEVPDFVPTRHELITLVKHWEEEALRVRWTCVVFGQSGSTESRMLSFANRRIERIADLIGEEEVAKAVEKVWKHFGGQMDPRAWDIFLRAASMTLRQPDCAFSEATPRC